MKKFWDNPKLDQCLGMFSMAASIWINDIPIAVFGAALYLGGVIAEGRKA